MAGKNKKPGSLIGTIIAIYVLITFINNFTGYNMSIRVGNFIVPLIIGIIIISRIISMAGKSSKQGESDYSTRRSDSRYDFAEAAKGILGVPEKVVKSKDDKSMNKKSSKSQTSFGREKINEEIITIDETNHYAKQYKALYESGILTKEELKDRINKLNK